MSTMKQNKWWALSAFFVLILVSDAGAQQAKPDTKKHEQKVRDMITMEREEVAA